MRRRHALAVLPLVLLLAACGGGSKKSDTLSTSPSPGATCPATSQGTKDLASKPVVPAQHAPAPAKTTTYDIVCGTGPAVKNGDTVTVKYVGVLYTTGKEFDSTWKTGPSQTFQFQVGGGVIPGFSKGVTGMQVGGRRMVVIPAQEGYGAQGAGCDPTGAGCVIPPNAALIFVLDLVKIG